MFAKLGIKGIAGLLVLVGGLAVIAYESPVVAAGMGLVVLGFVLVLWGVVGGLLKRFGMGGMMGGGLE